MGKRVDEPDEESSAVRKQLIDAALEEFRIRGIDDFTVSGVAERGGIDPALIETQWHDRRVLLMDALLSRDRETVPVPDTGSLKSDLRAYTQSLTAQSLTPQARR